jgi:hypothetical protein
MLLLKLCALCLATGAASGSVAYLASFVSHGVNESIAYQVNESVVSREVKESDVSPEGDLGEPDSPSGPPEARRPPMHGPIPSQS